MKKFVAAYIDDALLLAGGGCILYGLSLWNPIITWVAGGMMLIGLGMLIGKAKAKHVID